MEVLLLITKILVSILFFAMAILMLVLCFKAKSIKKEFAGIEKMCREDLKKIYQTGSIITKVIIELVLAKQTLSIGKFFK